MVANVNIATQIVKFKHFNSGLLPDLMPRQMKNASVFDLLYHDYETN